MTGDDSTIRRCIRKLTLLRSPSAKLKKSLARKVTLEKVLGLTTAGNSSLTCDPCSGLVAYPAGCVVVLLSPDTSTQRHIINTSTKSITALSFSPDGKYLVTGESGHLPAVRVWDVAECRQVAELQRHKYGVSCVRFSPDGRSIVSVGNQHDMMVYVWAWKRDVVVAANKVSSKVTAVSFSEDSSYLVTAGNRHVKFWYLDHCKTGKSSAPVPLTGHAALLGELKNNFFCDVACGRGSTADSTFCITSSGLLCVFSCRRTLDKWVDLQTSAAQSLAVCEELVFCGCADGTVLVFSAAELRFVCTLPRPHALGTATTAATAKMPESMLPLLHTPGTSFTASHLFPAKTDAACYPNTVAVTYDPANHWLSCVYSDHSLYVWDVRDVHKVATVHSALFHGAGIWDLQMCPEVPGESDDGGRFFSCSADDTIRLWTVEGQGQSHIHSHTHNSIISDDLLNIIHKDGYSAAAALQGSGSTARVNTEKAVDGQTQAENRAGIRTMCVSPDGKHLASGDRNGILRIHDLRTMEEVLRVQAHSAEILCLEYSKPETGVKLLATAGRDRLVHVLDAENDYSLLQTLDEHSSSITAIRFAASDNQVKMISCGADKSIYFHTSTRTENGMEFMRCHHVVLKTTPHDMAIDPTGKYAAVGCQDRSIRVFNISSGKQKKLYKGSLNEDGSLLKVQMDLSGRYVATVCSDKNISILDVDTGECVATMFGHSELVTGMKFTNDCKRLISVSADSCVFVWHLAEELTINMRERLGQLRQIPRPPAPVYKSSSLRREVKSAPCLGEVIDALRAPDVAKRRRRLWSLRKGSLDLVVKSMVDLRQLETLSPPKDPSAPLQDRDPKRNDRSAILQSRREVNSAPCLGDVWSGSEREHVEGKAERSSDPSVPEEIPAVIHSDSGQGDEDRACSDEPATKVASDVPTVPAVARRARRHWSRCRESMKLTVKSMVDLRRPEKNPDSLLQDDRDPGTSCNLQDSKQLDMSQKHQEWCPSDCLSSHAIRTSDTNTRREAVNSAPYLGDVSSDSGDGDPSDPSDLEEIPTDVNSDSSQSDEETACSHEPAAWEMTKVGSDDVLTVPAVAKRARRHWSRCRRLTMKSMVDLRQLETLSPMEDPDSPLHDRDPDTSCNLQDSKQMEKSQKHQGCPPADRLSTHASRTSKETDRDLLHLSWNEDNSDLVKDHHPGPLQGRETPVSPDSAFYGSRESSPSLAFHDSEDMLSSCQDSSDGERKEEEEEESEVEVKSMDEALRTVSDVLDWGQEEDVFEHNLEMLEDDSVFMDEQDATPLTPTLSSAARYLAGGHHDRRKPLFAKAHERDAGGHSAWPLVSKVRPLVDGGRTKSTVVKNSIYCGRTEETNPQGRETGHRERESGSVMQRAFRNRTRSRCQASSEPVCRTDAGARDRDPVPASLPQKKRLSSGAGRPSNLPASPRNPLSLVKAAGLRKSQSVLSLTSNTLRSTAPSTDGREALRQRPAPQSLDTPPRASSSPKMPRASSSSSSSQTCPSLTSPKHSLCLKGTKGCDWFTGGQIKVSPPGDNRKALGKRLSLPSSLPIRLNNRALSESAKERPLVPAQPLTLTADPQSDVSVNVEACRQAAAQLHDSLKRTAELYTKVLSCGPEPSQEQQHMRRILWEALGSMSPSSLLLLLPPEPRVRGDDDGPPGGPSSSPADPGVHGDDGGERRTLVLLEKYSELLLKSVEKRLENKT